MSYATFFFIHAPPLATINFRYYTTAIVCYFPSSNSPIGQRNPKDVLLHPIDKRKTGNSANNTFATLHKYTFKPITFAREDKVQFHALFFGILPFDNDMSHPQMSLSFNDVLGRNLSL